MLTLLAKAEEILPILLEKEEIWTGLFVDYHHPYVERLWTQVNENRISLHKIYPCQRKESLFHPHPWPQAVKILKDGYEMGVGYGEHSENSPSMVSTLYLPEGSTYEIVDPKGWHYVRPIKKPSYSIMITGKPWHSEKKSSKEKLKLRSLTPSEKIALLSIFRKLFSK